MLRDLRYFSFVGCFPLFWGGLLGVSIAIGLVVWISRDKTPYLTRESFDAAVARWREHGPADYDLDLVVQGNQPGKIHVEVRGGEVTAMTRDGISPSQRRTWDYWTVPGQFDMMQIELDSQSDPRSRFAGASGSQLVLWADFDPVYGYPWLYRRVVLDSRQDMQWQVTRFEPR